MKRRSFLKQATAGVAAGAVAAPVIAQSQPSIQWRLAASWPKSLDTLFGDADLVARRVGELTDRKSTRLNSSHDQISYAVFCLKKKKKSSYGTAGKHCHRCPTRRPQRRDLVPQ